MIRAPFLPQRNAEISAVPSRESGITHEKKTDELQVFKNSNLSKIR